MLTLKHVTLTAGLMLGLLTTAVGQEPVSPTVPASTVSITAAASGGRVRITAPSSVVQMRIEIYSASGQKVVDTEVRGANVFDWHLQDGQGQRVAEGSYVCVVTVKSVSGKLTQKMGSVTVDPTATSVQTASTERLSAPQSQAIGPVEQNSSWSIIGDDQTQTPTVIAHDGTDGQIIRGRGALSFRVGDFFSGTDREQMRLTQEGNVGIGTNTPQARLDVAGVIRAEQFLLARPKSAGGDKEVSTITSTGAVTYQPLISGTGSTDRIAKWLDNLGNLGDSTITQTGSGVGIGTGSPTQALEVANGRFLLSGNQTISVPGGMIEIATTLTNNNNQAAGIRMRNIYNGNADSQSALDVAPTFAPSASISLARGFISTAFFAPPAGVTITDGYGGNANVVYSNTGGAVTNGTAFAIRTPIVQGLLKPATQYGLRILNQGVSGSANSYGLFVDNQAGSTNSYSAIFAGGNVGIGTTTPTSKLDVNGDINVTGNAVISGNIAAKYQDVAEWVPTRKQILAGTVVIVDPQVNNSVVPSNHVYDTHVAGVVSEKPGLILGEAAADKVLVATTGRVRVQVDATRNPIKIGDLLVSSNIAGFAMKSIPIKVNGVLIHRPGTIIGKALEPLAKGKGTILVLLSLQ